MSGYYPFDNGIHELTPTDIYELDIPEGIYIEYKESLIERGEIAKSISSFANTYGGLLIFGIREDEITNEPDEYFTLFTSDEQQLQETIRNTARDYINPTPDFGTYLVQQSESSDNGVIIVQIPESNNTPHINNDGRVYRRSGEGTDPYRFETNPGVFDELYDRRERRKEQIAQFCTRDVGITAGQAGSTEHQQQGWPILELYGIPSTLGTPVCSAVLQDLDGFKQIMELADWRIFDEEGEHEISQDELPRMGLSFDSYRSTGSGVVAQSWGVDVDTGRTNISHTPLTVSFYQDGSFKLFYPLKTLQESTIPPWLSATFSRELGGDATLPTLIDGQQTIQIIYTIFNSYLNLLHEYNWMAESNRRLNVWGKFVNGFRTMTIFDSDWFRDFIQTYGLPICYEDGVEFPRDGWSQIAVSENLYSNDMYFVLYVMLEAFGIPFEQFDHTTEELVALFDQ